MPRGDRTGPAGQGAMTGRRAGFCSGAGAPGFTTAGGGYYGRDFGGGGFGGGGGRGWRNMYHATGQPGWMRTGAAPAGYGPQGNVQPRDEKLWLKNQADALQAELNSIKQRLDEIDSADANK